MAAIAFNALHQAAQVRGRLETVFTRLHGMLDAFVSYRMRLAAAAAGHPRPKRIAAADEHAMIAMQLTGPDLSSRPVPGCSAIAPGRESERPGDLEAGEPAAGDAPFRPLDSGIVSDAIPAFFIGRNKDGFWVARDAKGTIGGLFLFKNSALSFARNNSRPTGCAAIFPARQIDLDLENSGNALVPHLGSLKRLATRHLQRMLAVIGG